MVAEPMWWVGCGAYVVAGWVLKLKLMLTQPPTKLELELGLSLAINHSLISGSKGVVQGVAGILSVGK